MRLIKLIAAVFILIVFGMSCGQPTTNENEREQPGVSERTNGTRGGKLTYRISSQPKSFNYIMADDEASVIVAVYLLGSRLVAFDHSTQKFAPALAESWSTSPDGLTVSMKLRAGLKFSDGHPLTSDDVIFTLESIYDKRTGSPAFRDALLVNGKEIVAKRLSDTELEFRFPERVAGASNYFDNVVVLPKHILSKDRDAGKLGESFGSTAEPSSIVTSGPFTVESVTPGERIVLKRNAHYWRTDGAGVQLPYLDQISLEIVPDANNAFSRLGQGELDIVDRIRGSDYAALRNSSGPVRAIDLGPGLSNDHIWFNLNSATSTGERLDDKPKHSWFSNRLFRKAIAHAVDRDSIARSAMQGLATPLYGFVPVGNKVWLDPDLPRAEYDLVRSKLLLEEAGFELNETNETPELFDKAGNKVEFTLIVQAENEPRKLSAAILQQDLAKLGIRMQIAALETPQVTERWSLTFEYDAISLGLAVSGIEPSGFATFLLSSAAVHQWHPRQKTPATDWEARVDKLFNEQAVESDEIKRKLLVNEIQRILADESPIIPVVSRHIVSAANKRVGNHFPSTILPYSMWNSEELYIIH